MARRIEMTNADKDVHPAVLVLGEHMSAFAISDSVTRLEATLYAFQKVRNSAPVM
jgi:translation initiation factor eIF-2B subunit delta